MRIFPVLLLPFLAVACSRHPAPVTPAPAPPPATPSTPDDALPPPPRPTFQGVIDPAMECVVRGGRMEMVEIDPRDSTYQGQPFARAFPVDSTFAENAAWYRYSEPLAVGEGRYVKYGLPRILGTTDVIPIAVFRGVTVFAEPSANRRRPEVIYIPVRPRCEFQPYMGTGIK